LSHLCSRPADEPAAPAGHWTFLLQEMEWLSNDMAQERLWKQAAAVAIGYEVARLRGKFGLRPPPEGQRGAHDEIVAARAAAAREAGERTSGRRSGEHWSACTCCHIVWWYASHADSLLCSPPPPPPPI
jgi:hypothetical protein